MSQSCKLAPRPWGFTPSRHVPSPAFWYAYYGCKSSTHFLHCFWFSWQVSDVENIFLFFFSLKSLSIIKISAIFLSKISFFTSPQFSSQAPWHRCSCPSSNQPYTPYILSEDIHRQSHTSWLNDKFYTQPVWKVCQLMIYLQICTTCDILEVSNTTSKDGLGNGVCSVRI